METAIVRPEVHPIVLVIVACTLSCGSEDNSSDSDSDTNTDKAAVDGGDTSIDGGIDSVVPLQPGLEITIESGVVKGKEVEDTRAFLGIPYAVPPVGPLRFTPPQPIAPWTEPHNGTRPGNTCPQLGLGSSFVAFRNEDCLHVDVWTQKTTPEKLLPVMVWIYGGGFSYGSTNDYSGHVLAKEEVVLVMVNYRLGPLGFLAHPALADENPASGNLGLQDQQLALEWVQKNIVAFGGDPDNVTLFGQSAGATSVCLQMVSPQSQGLFHRSILQSGACESLVQEQADAYEQGEELARVLQCDDPNETMDCLRSKSVDDLLVAEPDIETLERFFFAPVVDSVFLPKHPNTLLKEGLFAQVPVLLGTNRDEGGFFAFIGGLSSVTEEKYLEVLEEDTTSEDVPAAMALYPLADYDSPRDALIAFIGDRMFNCTMRRDALKMRQHGVPVFRYLFTQEITSGFLSDYGTVHGAEMPYVFGSIVQDSFELIDADIPLSQTIINYWRQFAIAGDPNREEALTWPPFESNNQQYIELKTEMSVETNFKEAQCSFWDVIQAE